MGIKINLNPGGAFLSAFLYSLPHTVQALIATIFTWAVTAFGAGIVFLFKKVNKNVLDAMLGFSAGVMISASFWSLLSPAAEMSQSLNMNTVFVLLSGFLSGGILLFCGDKLFSRLERSKGYAENSGSKRRCMLLIFSITLHNIPEGMAVGVAFGSLKYGLKGATLAGACLLALGIGLQNFPEGTAVSLPLMREGYSRPRAFFYGQLSGIVEPIAGVLGSILVLWVRFMLPYLLAFAAGAMIYVVVEELIPESQTNGRKDLMALFTLFGFSAMMLLDIALS
ncbi:MAG: ZIP family metal transporter [Clostridiales bacterium]|nr:ZIP family metal transporter [Clostridiales bacterium]